MKIEVIAPNGGDNLTKTKRPVTFKLQMNLVGLTKL